MSSEQEAVMSQVAWAIAAGLGLAAVTGVVWWFGRRRRGLSARVGLLLRALGVGLLAAAWVGPYWTARSRLLTVVAAVDVSDSVREELPKVFPQIRDYWKRLPRRSQGGTLLFAEEPWLIVPVGQVDSNLPARCAARVESADVPTTQTRIDRAVQVAVNVMPGWGSRRVLLVTDGAQTVGDVEHLVPRLRAERVAVDVLPLTPAERPDVVLVRLETPPQAAAGGPIPVTFVIRATQAGSVVLRTHVNGRRALEERLWMESGFRRVERTLTAPSGPEAELVAEVVADWDAAPENNRAGAVVRLDQEPQLLLVVGPEGPSPMARLFRDLPGLRWEVRSPDTLPRQASVYRRWDTVVFDDVPAAALTTAQQTALRDAVRQEGVGWLTLGGPHTYGLGGWSETPLEEAAPVRMVPPERYRPLALALVLDKSGSMAGLAEGLSKLDLALIATRAGLDVLRWRDRLALVAFDKEPEVLVAWASPADRDAVLDAVRRLRPGNGTDIPAALQTAGSLFQEVALPRKQLLLLTDGRSLGDLTAAVERLAAMQVGVGLLLIGGESPELEAAVHAANGRVYRLRSVRELPNIVFRESRQEGDVLVLRSTPVVPTENYRWGTPSFPPIAGYLAVSAKAAASVYLKTPSEDPILTGWWFGLGRVLTFAADGGRRWTSSWTQNPAVIAQWERWLRSVFRFQEEPFDVDLSIQGARLIVRVQEPEETTAETGTVRVRTPSGQTIVSDLTESGNAWMGAVECTEVGRYTVRVVFPGYGSVVRDVFYLGGAEERVAPSPELLGRLAHATGGMVYAPEGGWGPVMPAPAAQRRPLRLWLGTIGLLLVMTEWVVRQLGIPARRPRPERLPLFGRLSERMRTVRETALAPGEGRRHQQESAEQWSRLQAARDRARGEVPGRF